MNAETLSANEVIPSWLPVLPLRDVVVYPHMVIPLFVGRKPSIAALDVCSDSSKQVLLLAQKDPELDEPKPDDLYQVGCVATILQMLKLPDGTVKVLVEGLQRAKVTRFHDDDNYFAADIELLESDALAEREAEVLCRSLLTQFEQYVNLNKKVPPEVLSSLSNIDGPDRLADTIAAHVALKIEDKQGLLESGNVRERLELLMQLLESELDLLQVEKRIRGRVKKQMEKSQREYYLNEQMKAIQNELGSLDAGADDYDSLQAKIDSAGMTDEAREKANTELNRLRQMSPMSAEATVSRNYLDWLLSVPWKKRDKVSKDLGKAEKVLNTDHYGLEKVKERILEYLAVQKRVSKLKGPILCLVGPPGVGKTSLGQSIAKATGRSFVRMSLGGVRDEAEIRGHRRTYIGALPGKVIQKLSKVKVKNPLFLLDEVDKMAMDMRGDPASALLEVLDPEQNSTFNDHFLEVDYDLSDIMFIATSNSMDIPAPLLDRMEVINLSGYTEEEKLNIATKYLLPKQMQANGLKTKELSLSNKVILDIIRYYTREAGVRGLEREIAKICRKAVRNILSKKSLKQVTITARNLETYLGVKKYRFGLAEKDDHIGQVIGLAWTEVGGDLLTIESAIVAGKGKTTLTGRLGDVMQESIHTAITVARSRTQTLGLEPDFFEKNDIHIHVPEGAIPKDGPSAGIAMCTALVSVLTGIPVKAEVAMTGEITLRGEVLPIGGLKEKLLAALRGGIKTVIIPKENERHLKELPKSIKANLEICPVQWIDEVLAIALQKVPAPINPDETAENLLARENEESKEKGSERRH